MVDKIDPKDRIALVYISEIIATLENDKPEDNYHVESMVISGLRQIETGLVKVCKCNHTNSAHDQNKFDCEWCTCENFREE